MALVQGDVRVTVGVTGKGDTSVVRQAGKDVDSLGAKIGANMKKSSEPLYRVKEGFERLRGSVMFAVGAAAAMAGGIVALASAFSDSAKDIAAWEAVLKDVPASLERTSALIDEIDMKLGWRGPKTELEKLAEKLTTEFLDTAAKIDAATGAVKAYNEQLEVGTRIWGRVAFAWVEVEKQRDLAETRLHELLEAQGKQLASNLGILRETKRVADSFTGPPTEDGFDPMGGTIVVKAGAKNWGKPLARGATGARARVLGTQVGDFAGQDKWDGITDAQRFAARNPAPEVGFGESEGESSGGAGLSRAQMAATDVRDFASALSEALPGMDAFSVALGKISQMWGDYAESGKGAATATIKSVGAMALAGAEQIKNDRLRAGVLSVFHIGLGTALLFNPVTAAEGAAHIAGGLILGGIALASGGGGGGHSSGPKARQVARAPLSDRTQSGGVTFVVNGTYIAGHSAQETAADLYAMMQRGGSGFVPRAA